MFNRRQQPCDGINPIPVGSGMQVNLTTHYLTLCQSSFKGVLIWVISPRITCYVRNLGNLLSDIFALFTLLYVNPNSLLQWNNLFTIDIKWFTLIPDHLFAVFLFISVWTIFGEKAICNNGGKYQRELFDLKLLG